MAVVTGLAGLTLVPATAEGAGASPPAGGRYNVKTPTSTGFGGAVTSVDPEASRVGLQVLRRGGNAVDAATGKVDTLDGRETAPRSMPHDAFNDPSTGKPHHVTPELVTSGVAVGTLATWDSAPDRWGTRSLGRSLAPATRLAERGFVVDKTFHDQTADTPDRAPRPVRLLPGTARRPDRLDGPAPPHARQPRPARPARLPAHP